MSLIDDLKVYALNKVIDVLNTTTITFNSNPYNLYDLISSVFMGFYPKAILENAAGNRSIFMPISTVPTAMTNTQYISLVDSALNLYQQYLDVYTAIVAQIVSSSITTTGQIDTAWTTLNGSYTGNGRSAMPTVESLYNSISAIPAQLQSDWNQSNNTLKDFIKNKPTIPSAYVPPTPIYSSPNFASITTATQLSTTRDAMVNYVFPTSMTSILATQSLTATLQYADDSGMSANVVTVSTDVTGCSGILSLTLASRLQISGRIPAGKFRKVSLSQTGGATVPSSISSSQEVLI